VVDAARADQAVAHLEHLRDGHRLLAGRVAPVLDEDARVVGGEGEVLVAQPREPGDGVAPPGGDGRAPDELAAGLGWRARIFGEVWVASSP